MQFVYTGTNSRKETINGEIEAKNRNEAQEILSNQDITLINIDLKEPEKTLIDQFNVFNNPNAIDLIIFSKQMYSMLKSGVSIIKTINILGDSCKNEKMAKTLSNIVIRLESGYSFSDAINKYSNIFPKIMLALINVGEKTGTLDQSFKEIAAHLDKEHEIKKKIAAATRYPILVICTIFISLIIMNIIVIPAFAGFFSQFHAKLPLPTKILISTSKFTLRYWWLILSLMITGGILIINYIKTRTGKYLWDRAKIHLPIIGNIIQRALLARFAKSFALCFKTGIPLLESISLIAATCDNSYMEEQLLIMRNNIERGESITRSAQNTKMFNSLVLQMILIGEENGELDRLLEEVAAFYEQELDYDIKQLTTLVEPILIAIMAGMVLILALGIFLPMWELAQVTGRH